MGVEGLGEMVDILKNGIGKESSMYYVTYSKIRVIGISAHSVLYL
jgi:hypothetical protein